jgi:hypothetical protein
LFFNLTPCIPLSFEGEGEINIKEGLTPLLNSLMQRLFIKGSLKGLRPFKNNPSPSLHKGGG